MPSWESPYITCTVSFEALRSGGEVDCRTRQKSQLVQRGKSGYVPPGVAVSLGLRVAGQSADRTPDREGIDQCASKNGREVGASLSLWVAALGMVLLIGTGLSCA